MVDLERLKQSQSDAKADAREKAPKLRLTKEQKQYVEQLVSIENRIAVCREYIALWLSFFSPLASDLTTREIKPDEEKAFFQILTSLARKHFLFVELMNDAFEKGPDVLNLLCTSISLSNIQAMSENTRSKLELDWHTLYLEMNKTLGRLIRMLPGNLTLSQALAEMDRITTSEGNGIAATARVKGKK